MSFSQIKWAFLEKLTLSDQIICLEFLSNKVGSSGKKTTLSADKVGFSLINLIYLGKPILSAHTEKVGLSARTNKDVFQINPPSLRAQIISVYLDKPVYQRETHFI